MQNNIGVLPHRRALVIYLPEFVLLYGLSENASKYFKNVGKVIGVNAFAENGSRDKQAVENTPDVQSQRSKKKAKER